MIRGTLSLALAVIVGGSFVLLAGCPEPEPRRDPLRPDLDPDEPEPGPEEAPDPEPPPAPGAPGFERSELSGPDGVTIRYRFERA